MIYAKIQKVQMSTQSNDSLFVCPAVESLLDAYVYDVCLPVSFKTKNQVIKFKDQDNVKGEINLNNFDIYFGGVYYGKLVDKIPYAGDSSSEFDTIHFMTRRLTKILNSNGEPVVDIYYSELGIATAINLQDNTDIEEVTNILSGILLSIKTYCNKNFGIDMCKLENFYGSKKVKLSEASVLSLINK